MAFSYQKDVQKYNKEAIAGDRANNQEVIYTPENLVTPADLGTAFAPVQVGGFAQVKYSGSAPAVGFVSLVADGKGGLLDPSDLIITVDGYASPEDYEQALQQMGVNFNDEN
mgnify:CR=1 FL=1